MTIRYECDQCGSVLKIKAELAGKPGKCPKCKTPFTVPDASNESEVSTDTIAEGSPEDSDALLASANSPVSKVDFDLDAFLSEDDEPGSRSKSKAAKAPPPDSESDDDIPLEQPEEKPKKKSAKASASESEETFEIRRGPDSHAKSKQGALSDIDDESVEEAPTQTRRPPGTNPNAGASNMASDLLSKSAKKGKKSAWDEPPPEPKKDTEAFDWDALFYEAKTKLLPIGGGGGVLVLLLYFFVYPMFGTKAYVPQLGQVSGVVKLNGKPVPGITIWFHPSHRTEKVGDKSFKVSESVGQTDANGHYEMIYNGVHKGVVLGKCRIEVSTSDYTGIAPKYYLQSSESMIKEVAPGKQIIDLELSQ